MQAAYKESGERCVESSRLPHISGDGLRVRCRRRNRWLPRQLEPLNLDARDAPAVHFHDGEAISLEVKILSAPRDESELREHKSSHGGVGGIIRQQDVVL